MSSTKEYKPFIPYCCTTNAVKTECNNCELYSKTSFCSRCRIAKYCSQKCQLQDWSDHKKYCDFIRKQHETNHSPEPEFKEQIKKQEQIIEQIKEQVKEQEQIIEQIKEQVKEQEQIIEPVKEPVKELEQVKEPIKEISKSNINLRLMKGHCSNCFSAKGLLCRGCLVENYCSVKCQADGWIEHKKYCSFLKKQFNLIYELMKLIQEKMYRILSSLAVIRKCRPNYFLSTGNCQILLMDILINKNGLIFALPLFQEHSVLKDDTLSVNIILVDDDWNYFTDLNNITKNNTCIRIHKNLDLFKTFVDNEIDIEKYQVNINEIEKAFSEAFLD